jgi:hypothetical protein
MSWAMWRACGVACMVDTPLPPPDAPARELVPRTVPRTVSASRPQSPQSACENFLYGFKAARRAARAADPDPRTEPAIWTRIQNGRSALHLLCANRTVEAAEALVTGGNPTQPETRGGPQDDETIALLRDLVQRLRHELDAVTG